MNLGFRVLDGKTGTRRPIDWAVAFRAYAECDERAETHRPAYLSAFTYGRDFSEYLDDHDGSTAGFSGLCWALWLWWDIDREGDLSAALQDARRLAMAASERLGIDDGDVLAFYSGSKGFHLGVPTGLWHPEPSPEFHKVARRFAEHLAELAAVSIDSGTYSKVQLFRAPNSRHAKTGRYKRYLSVDELMHLSVDAILDRAIEPEPFEIPEPTGCSDQAIELWARAKDEVRQAAEAARQRRVRGIEGARLNRATLELIRDGCAAPVGERHLRLFSAAANLAEFGCPPTLAHALLTESGLDSGLPPKEVERQIDCGLANATEGQTDG